MMRQDQFERMQTLIEDLTDAAIFEADPAKWPGAGIEPASMEQQTRGDRYWCKKNAAATLTLTMKCMSLVGVIQQRGAGSPPPDGEQQEDGEPSDEMNLDAQVKSAEKQASKLLAAVQKRVALRNA